MYASDNKYLDKYTKTYQTLGAEIIQTSNIAEEFPIKTPSDDKNLSSFSFDYLLHVELKCILKDLLTVEGPNDVSLLPLWKVIYMMIYMLYRQIHGTISLMD